MRRKTLALAAGAASLALVGGGTTAYASLSKTVTVSVDGKRSTVHTFAGDVAGALQAQGLRVGAHDSLAPAQTAGIADGTLITLRRGRLLTLNVDGQQRRVWVQATSVNEALQALGMRATGAFLSASRSGRIPLGGLHLTMRLPHQVSVTADGHRRALVTTAPTVAGVLAQAKVALGRTDKVSVPLAAYPVEGTAIRVTRIVSKKVTRTSAVAYSTQRRNSSTLTKGHTSTVQTGRAGRATKVYLVTYTDRKVTATKLVSSRVTTAPRPQILLVGTKPAPAPAPAPSTGGGIPSGGGLNWAALANCESGGNPRAVSSSGAYRGLYQFSLSTWASVGGSGDPINASAGEQTLRAQILYSRAGSSPWPVCGRYL